MITIDTAENSFDKKQIIKITTDKKEFSIIVSEDDGGTLNIKKYGNDVGIELLASSDQPGKVVVK